MSQIHVWMKRAGTIATACLLFATSTGMIRAEEVKEIIVSDNGRTTEYSTRATIVADFLDEKRISVRETDELSVPYEETVTDEMEIEITRVDYEVVTSTKNVPYHTVRQANPTLEKGTTIVLSQGEMGELVETTQIRYENGEEVARNTDAQFAKLPVDCVLEYGTQEVVTTASGERFSYSRVIDCLATAYDASAEENGGYAGQTATGVPLLPGVVAVDPRVIPLGSRLYIEVVGTKGWSGGDYGFAVAADTGGAIKGNRVDLFFASRSVCNNFGRRDVRVYVLD